MLLPIVLEQFPEPKNDTHYFFTREILLSGSVQNFIQVMPNLAFQSIRVVTQFQFAI